MKKTALNHIPRSLVRYVVLGAAALSLMPAAAPSAFARLSAAADDGVRLAGGEFLKATVLAVVSARRVSHERVKDARAVNVGRPAARGQEVFAPNNMTPSAGGKQLVMMLWMPRERAGNLLHQRITPN